MGQTQTIVRAFFAPSVVRFGDRLQQSPLPQHAGHALQGMQLTVHGIGLHHGIQSHGQRIDLSIQIGLQGRQQSTNVFRLQAQVIQTVQVELMVVGDRAHTGDNTRMNPLLSRLQPYPFERLRRLFQDVQPNPAYRPISLGIGEPRHATPMFIKEALMGAFGEIGRAHV